MAALGANPGSFDWSIERTSMFGKEEGSSPIVQSNLNSILGKGARFKGTFEGAGTVRIESELEGTIRGADSVVVGKTGVVRGEIYAKQVVVTGRVEGRIVATEKLELQSESHVQADVYSPRLIISEGVFFEGNCKMQKVDEDIPPIQGSGTLKGMDKVTDAAATWKQMTEGSAESRTVKKA
jgi:cytoskeletal protein CcmA (bactofilin family)